MPGEVFQRYVVQKDDRPGEPATVYHRRQPDTHRTDRQDEEEDAVLNGYHINTGLYCAQPQARGYIENNTWNPEKNTIAFLVPADLGKGTYTVALATQFSDNPKGY